MIIVPFVTLLLWSLTTVTARKPQAVALLPAHHLNQITSIRGGQLNAKDTAYAAACLFGAQGVHATLAPAKANEAYGLPSTPIDDFIMARSGAYMIGNALLAWELIVNGGDLNRAFGISSIP
jgi:hypothetical protein